MIVSGKILGVNGDVIDCDPDSDPYRLAAGQSFFGAAPVDVSFSEAAGLLAGSLSGRARHLARPIVWRVVVNKPGDRIGFLEALDRLVAATTPVAAGTNQGRDVRLVVTRADGQARMIPARYTSGLTGIQLEHANIDAAELELTFRAAAPHWLDLDSATASISFPVTGTGATTSGFDSASILFNEPGHPFDGHQSTEAEGTSQADLTVNGTAEAWPVWQITGDAATVEVLHRRTGRRWRWEGTLLAGEVLEVNTDDRRPSVRVDGVNAWDGMVAGSSLFPLLPGSNPVVVAVGGAAGSTAMTAAWVDAYLTP